MFDCCGCRSSNPVCLTRPEQEPYANPGLQPHIEQLCVYKVQMMELALDRRNSERKWFAESDQYIGWDSSLENDVLVSHGLGRSKVLDVRICICQSCGRNITTVCLQVVTELEDCSEFQAFKKQPESGRQIRMVYVMENMKVMMLVALGTRIVLQSRLNLGTTKS